MGLLLSSYSPETRFLGLKALRRFKTILITFLRTSLYFLLTLLIVACIND